MTRYIFLAVFLTVFLALPAPVQAAEPGEFKLAAADLMKCMEKCIRTNGKDEKESCKLSCSANMSFKNQAQDCMAIYKSCRKGCDKNKATKNGCKKTCRKAKQNCV